MKLKNIILPSLFMLPLLALTSGCISFEYRGEKLPEHGGEVILYQNQAAAENEKYEVIGHAIVSGNYLEVSRSALEDELISKAKAYGASAVIIVGERIVPESEQEYGFAATPNGIWADNTLIDGFEGAYGRVGAIENRGSRTLESYRRVLYAEFVVDDSEAAPAADTEQTPASSVEE